MSRHKNRKNRPATNGEDQPAEVSMGFIRTWLEICQKHANAAIAVLTGVIALTGIVYAIFSGLQWASISGQLTEMQNTNRPYIFTEAKFSFTQMPTPESIRDIPITVVMKNVGVSPALKVIGSDPIVGLESDSYVAEHLRTCSVSYPSAEGVPLPPNQSTHTITRTLSEDERKDVVINKTKHLIVIGGVKYSGVRAGDYETTYCYIWNPESLAGHTFPWSDCPCNKMK
jgi:hypothetical protein